MRRIAVVLVDRANLGRLLPVIEEIDAHPDLELVSILGGTMLLPRFGLPADDYPFEIHGYALTLLEGNCGTSSAMSMGRAIAAYARELSQLDPDLVLIIGDKYDALGAGQAALHLDIPICHFQGGEVSGCLDDKWRNCLTCISVYHVPATRMAQKRILSLGIGVDRVLGIGCPSADLAARIEIPPRGDRVLVCYHPDTAFANLAFGDEMAAILEACDCRPVDVMWPNSDAHADEISKAIRRFKHGHRIETHINVPPAKYLEMLASAWCCVGNSSSFIRDAGYFGTPVCLVGTRQNGREHGPNVVFVPDASGVAEYLYRLSISQPVYPPSDLYGRPGISKQVVERIAAL